MAFTLSDLPYGSDALAPHMSAETLSFHHGKHHKTYVDNLNKLVQDKPEAGKTLEEIILSAQGPMFNNAAQIWNHDFFWKSMRPGGGGTPSGALAKKITEDFGSAEAFATKLSTAAATQFGSGWAWLVKTKSGELKITSTPNQDNPISNGEFPILGNDVWEHAYYLKYQNRRPDYLKAWWNVVNWDEVNKRLAQADKFLK